MLYRTRSFQLLYNKDGVVLEISNRERQRREGPLKYALTYKKLFLGVRCGEKAAARLVRLWSNRGARDLAPLPTARWQNQKKQHTF